MAKISQQEKDWRAEEDARTMARYQEIMGDRSRMSRAVRAAKLQAKDLNTRAAAMNRVASTRSASKSRKK